MLTSLMRLDGKVAVIRHPPVLSGEYRDLKYAKTGFTAARAG
jgi:hypothetical protein